MDALPLTLEDRIRTLERRCARLRLWCIGVLVVALVAHLSSAIRPAPAVVQAKEFLLIDEKGHVRGRLGTDHDTPAAVSLSLNSNGIDEGVRLLCGPELSELMVSGDDDSGAAWLGVSGTSANLALLTPAAGTKVVVASMGADKLAGSLTVSKVEELQGQGEKGFRTASSFQWPEKPVVEKTGK